MTSTLLLDVVGLTPRALAHMPRLQALAASGAQARLGTVLPAVTCSVQSTMLTGLPPAQHGIVGNGWYFRDTGEVHLWRQHNALVQGEKVWETARRARPGRRRVTGARTVAGRSPGAAGMPSPGRSGVPA